MKKIKYSSMYGKFGNNEKEVEPIDNIIIQKTTIRVCDGIKSTIKKEVNVPIIPTCKTCSKRRAKCAKNNIVCEKYSLLNEKKKKLGALQTTLKAASSAATMIMAISVTLAPRARIAVKASCPGVSKNVI